MPLNEPHDSRITLLSCVCPEHHTRFKVFREYVRGPVRRTQHNCLPINHKQFRMQKWMLFTTLVLAYTSCVNTYYAQTIRAMGSSPMQISYSP